MITPHIEPLPTAIPQATREEEPTFDLIQLLCSMEREEIQ
jgi:hypothetical protein